MLKKVRSVCLTACVILIFFCVIIALGAMKCGVDFPAWTHIGDKESTLEGRVYTSLDKPTREGLLEGSFQDNFESYVADHIPMRDRVLLSNAAVQRSSIRFMAKVMGYDALPTFFGSDYIEVPSDGLVMEQSQKLPKSMKQAKRFVNAFNGIAKAYPDVNISMGLITEPRHSRGNPAYQLSGGDGLIDESWVQTEFVDKLDSALNAHVEGVWDINGLKDSWYRTDVHWTLKRATDAYNTLADDLGLAQAEWSDDRAIMAKGDWYGTAGRSALDYDFTSELVDQNIEFPNLKYYKLGKVAEGKEVSAGLRDDFLAGKITSDDIPTEGLNVKYFGGKNYEIINEGKNNGKTCLIVGDSFARSIFRYIANNYSHTIMVMPGNSKTKKSLRDLIEDYEVDDMAVILQCQKYGSIFDTSPNFLD